MRRSRGFGGLSETTLVLDLAVTELSSTETYFREMGYNVAMMADSTVTAAHFAGGSPISSTSTA